MLIGRAGAVLLLLCGCASSEDRHPCTPATEPEPDLSAAGAIHVVPAGGQGRYLVDARSHSCFLFVTPRLSAGPVDCHALAAAIPAVAEHVDWPTTAPSKGGTTARYEPAEGFDDGPSRPPKAAAEDEAPWRKGIARIDDHHYRVSSRALESLLERPSTLGRSVRIVPALVEGRPSGFKLFAIRPGSPWAALGFANGDTLQAINGQPLTSPAEALEAYAVLRSAREVSVELTRRGKPVTLRYTVYE